MKKIIYLPLLAAVCLTLASCGNNNKISRVNELTTPTDSFAYANGVRISEGFRYNAISRLGVDSTLIEDMMQGVMDAFYADNDKDRAYYIGTQYGTALREQVIKNIEARMKADGDSSELNRDVFYQAFYDAVSENDLLIDFTTSSVYVQAYEHMRHTNYMELKYADNKIRSEEFLEMNAKEPGVIVLPDGLQYKVEKMGKGPKPTMDQKVKVHYEGRLIDGTVFDSSLERKNPSVFGLNQVIKGWSEGLQLMPVGSKFTFYIPYDLAYGNQDRAKIRPYSALIFDVELLEIVK